MKPDPSSHDQVPGKHFVLFPGMDILIFYDCYCLISVSLSRSPRIKTRTRLTGSNKLNLNLCIKSKTSTFHRVHGCTPSLPESLPEGTHSASNHPPTTLITLQGHLHHHLSQTTRRVALRPLNQPGRDPTGDSPHRHYPSPHYPSLQYSGIYQVN